MEREQQDYNDVYVTHAPKQFVTRSNENIWVAKGNSSCEVIATVFCITLPVYKLVLLCL